MGGRRKVECSLDAMGAEEVKWRWNVVQMGAEEVKGRGNVVQMGAGEVERRGNVVQMGAGQVNINILLRILQIKKFYILYYSVVRQRMEGGNTINFKFIITPKPN